MEPVDMREVYDELKQPKYSNIFDRIYGSAELQNHQDPDKYTNPYMVHEFKITRHPAQANLRFSLKKEYVFMCLLRKRKIDDCLKSDAEWIDEDSNEDSEEYADASDEEEEQPVPHTGEPTGERHSDERNVTEENSDERNSTEDERLNDIIPIYVSKAYDAQGGVHVHHFIFLDETQFDNEGLMIVEKCAEAYIRPDFNVELHYLELRKHNQLGKVFS